MSGDDGAHGLRRTLLRTLEAALPAPPERWALLPVPLHGNVGDSAILLGTLEALEALGWPPPTVMADVASFDPAGVSRRIGAGPVVLMGGGHFGDLWPAEHAVRIRALRELRDHPVVQLPQSAHFTRRGTEEETARALEGHPAVTLMIRDRPSVAHVRERLGLEGVLCPDMAFGLGPLERPRPRSDVLRLLRQDREAGPDVPGAKARAAGVDWVTDAPSWRLAAERRLRDLGLRRRALRPLADRARSGLQRGLASERLRRGTALLGSARVVISNRLHGHVLSVLLGIPHVAVDDAHGKIAGFVDSWTVDVAGVHLCATLAEAEVVAASLRTEAVG